MTQRCSKEKGVYWPLISHIPCVEIDDGHDIVVGELLGEERLFQGDEELVFEQELGSFGCEAKASKLGNSATLDAGKDGELMNGKITSRSY
ncbi:hypothetical protein POTOM_002025 [Populus tomentosa]|uniref:Uncharacterized protein n=1 Tax=Populus tomentosa TaxID=118781 RepID=A0A8X8DIX7_POPTO|nr:hypothetical protein POTOM_002025 [Populus tomentosa]